MNTLALSFLIGSFSFLQVTMTCMKSLDKYEFVTELPPLIDVRIEFLFNILKKIGRLSSTRSTLVL